MNDQCLTAWCGGYLGYSGVGHVMVKELAELHDHQGISVVGNVHLLVDFAADLTRQG